jgi:hypothetical protein
MESFSEYKQSRVFALRPEAYAYGYSAGILQSESGTLPIPGDLNHASTFEYPVLYQPVETASHDRLAAADTGLVQPITEAARALEAQGARFLAADSGLFARYRRQITQSVGIPFVTSLHLLPLIAEQFLGGVKTLCVITADDRLVNADLLAGEFGGHHKVVVAGLQDTPAIAEQVLAGADTLDTDAVESAVVAVAHEACTDHPDCGAFLLESSMLPVYAHAVQRATALPVYDATNIMQYLHDATHQQEYTGAY